MKYSFMTFSCPELTFEQVVDAAKRFGYDGVEPRIDSGHAHGVEPDASAAVRRELRALAESKGVAVACIATSCRFADPATGSDFVEQAHAAIDLAADMGAPVIRVFGGQFPAELDREAATDQVCRSLAALGDHAGGRDVTVCMETHDSWCDPNHVATVMSRVDHPAIAVNWDIMHPIRRGNATMDSAFEALKPWIRHLHIHDGVDEGNRTELVPIGEGTIDHRRAVELLLDAGYDGFLSGEWINWSDPWEVHLPRELQAMKRFEAAP